MLAFYVEILRVKENVTDCAMPPNPFKGLERYRGIIIENADAARTVAEVEIKSREEYRRLRDEGLDLIAYPSVMSRVIPAEPFPDFIIYVFRRDKRDRIERVLRRIRRFEIRALGGSFKHALKVMREEGKLLGYPECCVNHFVSMKGEGSPPETEVVRKCIELGFLGKALELFKRKSDEIPEDFYSFFASNFYPCEPGCRRAVEIGERVERRIVDESMRKFYRFKIVLNVLNILASAYATYEFVTARGARSEFGKIVLKFFKSLPRDDLKIVRGIATGILNDQLKFESEALLSIRTM